MNHQTMFRHWINTVRRGGSLILLSLLLAQTVLVSRAGMLDCILRSSDGVTFESVPQDPGTGLGDLMQVSESHQVVRSMSPEMDGRSRLRPASLSRLAAEKNAGAVSLPSNVVRVPFLAPAVTFNVVEQKVEIGLPFPSDFDCTCVDME